MSIITIFKNHWKKLLIPAGIIIYVIISYKEDVPGILPQTSFPTPTSSQTSQNTKPNFTRAKYKYYLSSLKIKINRPILSLYWQKDKPLYQAANSIYNFDDSKIVYTFPIAGNPYFSPHSSFLGLASSTALHIYNPQTSISKKIPNISQAYYSPSYQKYALLTSSEIEINNIDGTNFKKISLTIPITKLYWSPFENFFIGTNNLNQIIKIDISTSEIKTLAQIDKIQKIQTSPSGKYVSVLTNQDLKIIEVNSKQITSYKYNQTTIEYLSLWTPQDSVFLIEKENPPRSIDFIYYIDPKDPQKYAIGGSMGISSGFNLKITPASPSEKALIIIDNENQPWILSTQPANLLQPLDKSD